MAKVGAGNVSLLSHDFIFESNASAHRGRPNAEGCHNSCHSGGIHCDRGNASS